MIRSLLLAMFLLCTTALAAGAQAGTAEQPQSSEPFTYKLGSPLSYPTAIDVDEYGRLYVLDTARLALMRFSLTGELERVWSDRNQMVSTQIGYDPWSEFSVAPGERIFVAADEDHRHGVAVVGPDSQLIPIRSQLKNYTAASQDGTCYFYGEDVVGNEKDGYKREGSIQVCGADGTITDHWVVPEIYGLAAGPEGAYIIVKNQNLIKVYSPQGKHLRDVVLEGITVGEYRNLEWLAVDTNGDIYCADNYFNVVRADSTGHIIKKWQNRRTDTAMPGLIRDMAVRNGIIYTLVHDGGYSKEPAQILAYTPDGQCIACYQPQVPEMSLPAAIAVHSDGSYAVEQLGEKNVLLFGTDGKLSSRFLDNNTFSIVADPNEGYCISNSYFIHRIDSQGKRGQDVLKSYADEDRYCYDVAGHITRDPGTGNLWALANGKGKLEFVIFGPDFKETKRLPVLDKGYTSELAIDPAGFLYKSGCGQHLIYKYNLSGELLGEFGGEGSDLGKFIYPNGMVVDKQGRLFVADAGNCRIQVFGKDGKPLGFWGHRGRGDGELDRPLGVAIGPNNTLWITDTYNDRIVRIPIDQLMRNLKREMEPEPVVLAPAKEPMPAAGKTTVTGIIIAGTDDFSDTVYVESPDRAWAMAVTLPQGMQVNRGTKCRITGVVSAGLKRVAAEIVEPIEASAVPGPLGMANLYVGNGFNYQGQQVSISNNCLLVRTWGRVTAVSSANSFFTINDGSGSGINIYARDLKSPLESWPKVAQYVGVTGVSVMETTSNNAAIPAVRIRNGADIQVMKE